jgi:Flp pilus assembly protein TadG
MMSLKFLRCQRGQAVVETTLSFILFMMVFYAVVEFSHLFYTKVNLQHAVSEAGRYMITGQGLDLSGTNPNARLAAVENRFCQNLIATGLSCANVASHFTVTCVGGCSQPAGGPGQTVTLTVTFTKPWLTAFFNNIIPLLPQGITLTANTTWKNEQYL